MLDQKLAEVHIDASTVNLWEEVELKIEAAGADVVGQRQQAVNYLVWKVNVRQLIEARIDAAMREAKRLLEEDVKSLDPTCKAKLWEFLSAILY